MRKILRKLFLATAGCTAIVATPIAVASCSATNRDNLVTTYDNAFDDVVSLGIKPDYFSAGNWTNYISKYVKEMGDEIGVKYLDFRFFPKGDGASLDPKKIASTNADVVVANITDSGRESSIKNVVNHVTYTGRGDDANWSYTDEQINFVDLKSKHTQNQETNNQSTETTLGDYIDVGIKNNNWTPISSGGEIINNTLFEGDYGYSSKLYEYQQNPFIALKKLAQSLDELSNNKNNFEQKAESIEQMQKDRLTALNKEPLITTNVNNKTIAFILGKKASSTANDTASNIQIYNPHTYPQFYSRKEDRGLKMLFPSFENYSTNFNNSHFADPDIIAGDSNSYNTFKNSTGGDNLITMFSHKFDYIVYMAYDGAEFMHTEDEVVNSDIKNLLKITNTSSSENQQQTTTTQSSTEEIKKHIFYTTYSDMYMSTWGPIGQSITISKFIEWINKNYANNSSSGTTKAVTEDESKILCKNLNLKDLKYWRDLK